LSRALKQIRKDTGILALSELADDPQVDVPRRATAWEALQSVASQANAQVLPPLRGSSLRLAPLPRGEKPLPYSLDREVRFRLHRVTASRDLSSGRGVVTLSLEAGWLPTLRPLFFANVPHAARAQSSAGKPIPTLAEGGGLVPADGRHTHLFDLPLAAPPRSEGTISLAEGKLAAVVAGEMLDFQLDATLDTLLGAREGGAVREKTVRGVSCTVERLVLGRDRWTIRLGLTYPPRSNRPLESHQAGSMVVFNEARLVSLDGKRSLAPAGSAADEISSGRTVMTFHFTMEGMAPRGKPSDWKVTYKAPARIMDESYRFSFRDIPLP
jgi:hypothetical protein